MRLATWNVNSLRVRLPHLLQWLTAEQPDVIALQETKLPDAQFPVGELQALGYFAAFSGQPTYNGVAILSKIPLTHVVLEAQGLSDPQHRRAMAATIGDVRLINFYVPNGQQVGSEKYQFKLQWLNAALAYLQQEMQQHTHVVVVGDFNIAPEDRDVHDPKSWQGQVLVSEEERHLFKLICELGFTDAFRLSKPEGGHFSWWDYRAGALHRNAGLRIDHILISPSLITACQNCMIDKAPRRWERPSDHVPVVIELAV